MVHAVSASLNGIGYSGIGYLTPAVKALALPHIHLHQAPSAQPPPTTREFLRLMLSRQGQEIVAKDGCIPLPLAAFEEERRKIR